MKRVIDHPDPRGWAQSRHPGHAWPRQENKNQVLRTWWHMRRWGGGGKLLLQKESLPQSLLDGPYSLQLPLPFRPSLCYQKTRNIGLFQEKWHSHFHGKMCLDSFLSEPEYCLNDRIGCTFSILHISTSWEPDAKLFPAKLIMALVVKLPGDPKKETGLHFQGPVTCVGCWVGSD